LTEISTVVNITVKSEVFGHTYFVVFLKQLQSTFLCNLK